MIITSVYIILKYIIPGSVKEEQLVKTFQIDTLLCAYSCFCCVMVRIFQYYVCRVYYGSILKHHKQTLTLGNRTLFPKPTSSKLPVDVILSSFCLFESRLEDLNFMALTL